jgi:low affinity Fe/Cu permease
MRKKFEDFSRKLTRWIGSTQSIIVHTLFFIAMFCLRFFGVSASDVLLILTTIVSLEAIYLSIFIQMTVNQHSEELEEVSEDIEDIQENVEDIQENVEDLQEEIQDEETPTL